jgi:hypothetical protein
MQDLHAAAVEVGEAASMQARIGCGSTRRRLLDKMSTSQRAVPSRRSAQVVVVAQAGLGKEGWPVPS